MKQVQIQSGDDLYSIAEAHSGSHKNWRYISLINDVGIFDDLDLSKPIQIPDPSELSSLIQAVESGNPEQIISSVASATGLKQLDALRGLASGNVDVSSVASSILDLSGIRQPNSEVYNLISWILP